MKADVFGRFSFPQSKREETEEEKKKKAASDRPDQESDLRYRFLFGQETAVHQAHSA